MCTSGLERLNVPASGDRGYAAYSRRARGSVGGESGSTGALRGAPGIEWIAAEIDGTNNRPTPPRVSFPCCMLTGRKARKAQSEAIAEFCMEQFIQIH